MLVSAMPTSLNTIGLVLNADATCSKYPYFLSLDLVSATLKKFSAHPIKVTRQVELLY